MIVNKQQNKRTYKSNFDATSYAIDSPVRKAP